MKRPIPTPDAPSGSVSPASAAGTASPARRALWRTAEGFAWLLTVLLPVKFASFVSAPEAGALYWTDPLSLVVIAWPLPVFMIAASALLVLTALAAAVRGDVPIRPALLKYGALWMVLGGVSFLGLADASCLGYPPQMIAHTLSMACYAVSLSVLLSGRKAFAKTLTGALVLGGVLSLASGLYQWWNGFEALREHVLAQAEAAGHAVINENFAAKLREQRIQADFASCNVYGAYLAAFLPFLAVAFWRFGDERVSPPKLSRRLFGGAVFAVTLFLLVKTDSRGGVLSLLAAGAALFFLSRLPRAWKLAGAALLCVGAAGLAAMFMFGRGGITFLVRLDYLQSAARIMLKHPLTGTGWGDYLFDHEVLRLWKSHETAHSPHNMLMLFGSQCGVAGFLAALAVLAYPAVEACRRARRTDWSFRSDLFLLVPAFSCMILVVGSLMDVSFETPAFCGALIAFSLLTLNSDGSAEPAEAKTALRRAGFALTVAFAAVSLVASAWYFRAERSFSRLTSELDPRFSFEHSADPNYRPPYDRVIQLVLRAAADAPRSPFPFIATVDYMLTDDRPKAALFCLDKAIEFSPLQSTLYVKRACINYALSGMTVTDAVGRDLEAARRLAPNNPGLNQPDDELCRRAFTPKEPEP